MLHADTRRFVTRWNAVLLALVSAGCLCGPATLSSSQGTGGGRDAGSGVGGGAGGGSGAGTGGAATGGGSGDAGETSCAGPSDCSAPAALCDLASRRCVECVTSSDCPTARPVCDPATATCEPSCKSSASCASPRPVCDPLIGACIEGDCALEGSCAAWRRGPWGPCSGGTCPGGTGTRTRTVACIDGFGAASTACPAPAPPSSESCFETVPCPSDAGVPDAGTSVADAGTPDAGAPDLCVMGTGALSSTPCHATVVMQTLTVSSSSCYVDVVAHPGDTAQLYWDCGAATGHAELRFATLTAAGPWSSPTVSVCFGTHFPWSDGCQWQSAQRVQGSPVSGATLQFSYEERPDPGQSGCASACTATGTFLVQ